MTKAHDINVLITGMGPYPNGIGGHIDVNTSHLITTPHSKEKSLTLGIAVLPPTLEPNTAQNPLSTRVNIMTLPDPVKSEYKYVRDFCKELHDKHADDVDLFIHLGEARGWDWLTIERVAYKQGNNAGLTIDDIGPCPWDGVPIGLHSQLDVEKIADSASAILESLETATQDSGTPIQIKLHNEGGPFLCGFISYESLANRYVRQLRPNVLFCHMPGEADAKSLARAGNGILAIAVSAVNEVLHQRKQAPVFLNSNGKLV
ncbi:pyroglutamyl peptidase [Seiridium cupressi]